MSKKNKNEFAIVGKAVQSFENNKLPSGRDVLGNFLFHYRINKKSLKKSSVLVSKSVLDIWQTFHISTRYSGHVVIKIKKLYNEWKILLGKRSNKKRYKNYMFSLVKYTIDFQNKLDRLFDIASASALNKDSKEAKAILLQHRNNFRLCKKQNLNESNDEIRNQEDEVSLPLETSQNKYNIDSDLTDTQKTHSDPSSLQSSQSSEALNTESLYPSPKISGRNYVKKKTNVLTNGIVSETLDRCKLSDRKAAMVISTMIASSSSNTDLNAVNISRSTLRRRRLNTRKDAALKIKACFNPNYQLTVHWDGKLLEDITLKKKVDRLPILISGNNEEQLLAVPFLQQATGTATADVVYETLTEWHVEDKIVAMCYDTTATNTGCRKGACLLLEKKLKRDLLYCSCRHHILELLLEAAFSTCFRESVGPDIQIFAKFKSSWNKINPANFITSENNEKTKETVQCVRLDLIKYAEEYIEKQQPRDDYSELLQLIITFLGGKTYPFRAPGAMHRARWMSRAIYSLKIWMLQQEFALEETEKDSLQRICLFVCLVYFVAWFASPVSITAPRMDLQLIKSVIDYQKFDIEISLAVQKKFCRHTWYLSEEMVCFAFFDDAVPVTTKKNMITALNKPGNEKRTLLADICLENIKKKDLHDFVSSRSRKFFEILRIDSSFLQLDPRDWNEDVAFMRAKDVCKSIRVVNDTAERGVALIQEFNQILTKDEKQKQYLLQVVSKHRKDFSQCTKKEITEQIKKRQKLE